jgi:flagellin-specific chaperone FliS
MIPQLTIDAELQALIAPLKPQEFELLKTQILEQGCLQPLCVWKTEDSRHILLDGHTRYKICADHNRRYTIINVRLASREHAKLWILQHQAGRRNLTDDQRAIVWNEIREQRSKIASEEGAAKARAAKADSVELTESEKPKRDTRAEVAREAKLSESKLRRAQKLKKYQPELYGKVLSGELTLREVVKEFPYSRKKTEVAKNHDFFRHLGNLLDGVFKGTLKKKLDHLVRIKPKEITPAAEKNILEIISILADVSRHADGYASKLEKILQSNKKVRAA